MTDDTSTARRLIRNAVLAMVRESGGQVTRISRGEPGAGWSEDAAGPLEGISAARHLELAAVQAFRDHARRAREDGLTWGAIGEAMGFADHPPRGMTSVAEHAFQRAVPVSSSVVYFVWTCPSCRQLVRDYGPELAPHDAEQGHADGCGRFAATLAEWDRQWGDE